MLTALAAGERTGACYWLLEGHLRLTRPKMRFGVDGTLKTLTARAAGEDMPMLVGNLVAILASVIGFMAL